MSDAEPTRSQELSIAVELRQISAELATERKTNRLAREYYLRAQPIYEELRVVLRAMQATKFWKLRQQWFALKKRLGVSRVGAAPEYNPPPMEKLAALEEDYERWRSRFAFREGDRVWMEAAVRAMRLQPRFSILVPTYNTPESYLRAMLDSVLTQVYPEWELCIADDASTEPHVRAVLAEYAAADPRVRYAVRERNGHIAAASNSSLELATGEFVALLDHDDVLAPDALFHNALVVNDDPDVDMVYSDEDKIDDDGIFSNPYFKPDWSPDRFLSQMYTAHLGVYRARLVRELGGFREGFEGSQDYDLVLRLTEHSDRVRHIPRVLYHWRIHAASTTAGMEVKPYAEIAALRALSEALQRRGEPGTVASMAGMPGSYLVRYATPRLPRVSIIVPTRDHAADVDRCLSSLFAKTEYPDFEVVLLDNGSKEFAALEIFKEWQRREPRRLKVVPYDVPFNFSQVNNYAVRTAATGEILLFLNNDTEIVSGDWLTAMVEQAQRSSIGAVGAKLLYGDDRVQHAGVVLGIGGIAGHAFRFYAKDHLGYYNALQMVVNYSAVTGACAMMRRAVFDEVGGFDETLAVAYNDVDLCLRIRERGYRIVYLPHVVVYHYESQSRGFDLTPDKIARDGREQAIMDARWHLSRVRDPYYNPNLTLLREDFTLVQ
jgi:GT2 family glycosyltransferase